MNYDDFIKTYKGKAIDYDGGCGVQCVDLAKLYLDKVFGIKIGAIGNAHAYYDKYNNVSALKNNFIRIPNSISFVPQKGDIAVWSKSMGGTGHIAICTGEGNTSYFYTYDQNWGTKEMKKVRHTYNKFLGVLRYRKEENSTNNQDTGIVIAHVKTKIDKAPLRNSMIHNTDKNVITHLKKGTELDILEIQNEWGRAIQGYINMNDCERQELFKAEVVVDKAPLRNSMQHNTDKNVLQHLKKGTKLSIVERHNNEWWSAPQGYVNKNDCKKI